MPVVADRMFAVTSGTLPAIRAPRVAASARPGPRARAALRVDAVRRGDYIIFTADELQRGLPVRFEDLEEVAAAAVPSEATPAASPAAAPIPEPVAFKAVVDPADGSSPRRPPSATTSPRSPPRWSPSRNLAPSRSSTAAPP